ncbi:MAG: UDP-N-acetylmuramoyl-tripeptide--D-alanyl-D-alanine ligase [Cytophagales bacterium]|nr:MAG: UDP-N-acetylmuramoyl-tripeptide--D-alanyl-D-alanine ligase [Cytophagales bacterium]
MEIADLYQLFINSNGIATDTRKIHEGAIFFALKGDNFNGNQFALKALEKGAKYAVIDEPLVEKNDRIILVDNALQTLQALANYHRRTFEIPFIAITGSNGKTTTKELVNAVLQKKYITYATLGNLNNHIGIPLTLLSIKKEVQIAIIEMGANHQKEIEGYCKYVEPNYGLITNIGKAHLEGFGGIEGVKKGKGELYDYLRANHGQIFLCTTNDTLVAMANIKNPITYPSLGDYYTCSFVDADPFIRFLSSNGKAISTQLTGKYNFDNIAVALCIGKYFGVSEEDALQAIATYNPQNNRSQLTKTDKNELIIDCYNANPTSMKAAIESFAQTQAKNKVLILGDMYELGEDEALEHEGIGNLILTLSFQQALLCGKAMKSAFDVAPEKFLYFQDRNLLIEWIKSNPFQGATLLIKGSRGMALEKVIEYL